MRSLGKNRTNKKGWRQGYWEFYYMDGKLHSKGLYKNGEKEGIWEYYYTDGSLDCKRIFENGYYIDYVK